MKSQRIFIDRSQSGRVDFNDHFAGRQWAPLALRDGALVLHVLIDRASLEVFADDGARVLSEQVFPAAASVGLSVYAKGGTAILHNAQWWDLDPRRH